MTTLEQAILSQKFNDKTKRNGMVKQDGINIRDISKCQTIMRFYGAARIGTKYILYKTNFSVWPQIPRQYQLHWSQNIYYATVGLSAAPYYQFTNSLLYSIRIRIVITRHCLDSIFLRWKNSSYKSWRHFKLLRKKQ